MQEYQLYINGCWQESTSGKTFLSYNPSIGRPWARIPRCNANDVDRAVNAAFQCFSMGSWPRMKASDRGKLLRRLGDSLIKNATMLAEIETTDNGKRTEDIKPGLVTWLADSFYYYGGLADKIQGRIIPTDTKNLFNFTRYEPFGVCGLITAWNSPLLIAIWKLAPALAAGNTAVVKPSEHASASTLALMEAFQDADLPRGLINVITGYGREVGEALVDHNLVRLVSFTGGLKSGKRVAEIAARSVKPTIMELGGKSPQIVFADANIETAVNGVAKGVFSSAGQSCIAGSRALVQKDLVGEFTKGISDIAKSVKLGCPKNPSTQIGPISNKHHFERVLSYIELANKEGAKCITGGKPFRPDKSTGWYIAPTIFIDVHPNMRIAKEEIFGPILAIMSFEDENQAITLANDTIFGLAAGIWTSDSARAIRLSERIEAGTIYINNYFNSSTQSPVGGFKQSGYGRENGIEGMQAYLQTKSVWLATKPGKAEAFF